MVFFKVLGMIAALDAITRASLAVRRVDEYRLYKAGPCLTEVQIETSRLLDGAKATFYGRCYQPREPIEAVYIAAFLAASEMSKYNEPRRRV